MRFSLRPILPETARAWLAADPRALPPPEHAALAGLLARGGWVPNGAPVVMAADGRVLDGRRRLAAAERAGLPLAGLVVEDLPRHLPLPCGVEGAARFADVLAAAGLPAARATDRLARLVLMQHDVQHDVQHDGAAPGRGSEPPWWRMQRLLALHPEIAAIAAAPLPAGCGVLPPDVARLLLFHGQRAAPAALGRVLEGLAAPGAVPPGHPGRWLAEAARAAAQGPAARAGLRLAAAAMEALSAALPGRRLDPAMPVARRALPWPEASARLEGAAPPPARRILPEPGLAGLEGCVLDLGLLSGAEAAALLAGGADPTGLSGARQRAFAREMRAGRWLLDPAPVCITAAGRVVDGRHRLLALAGTGLALPIPVLRGLPEAVAETYGRAGARRPAAAVKPGFGDAALAGAMANLLWRREVSTGREGRRKARAEEVEAILAAHPRLFALRTFARRNAEFARASVIGYAAYVIEREDPARAAEFLAVLDPGLPASGRSAALRRRLLRLRRLAAPPEEQLEAILEGWRASRAPAWLEAGA